ncbi:non-receptor serine/threonine protein kinase [Lithospermum erythrorhizon]|uniref:Non-receptor serine/threonine protein kinase n=1 Tax=Lithospermum erythrorhizon TaxID=34254 RepID=A0AAV3NYW4_LITER
MMSDDGLSSLASSSMRGFIQDPNINNNILIPNPNNPNPNINPNPSNSTPSTTNKRKRNMPGNPDPDAEVIALSPKSLMATNRFICEICNKGFQRDQNLQLHRRGHNLPWKLKQRNKLEVVRKKVYICPEKSCVHHEPSRALGDLTGIKKHYSRKHGEKKWKCEKCSKKYAVQSDWKAHSKICGTREYKCDCGTLFSRKDSFITHRAFCDALAEESARFTSVPTANLNFRNDLMNGPTTTPGISANLHNQFTGNNPQFSSVFSGLDPTSHHHHQLNLEGQKTRMPLWLDNNPNANSFLASSSSNLPEPLMPNMLGLSAQNQWFNNRGGGHQESSFGGGNASSSSTMMKEEEVNNKGNNFTEALNSMYYQNHQQQQQTTSSTPTAQMSATALLQKAAQMGSTRSSNNNNNNNNPSIFGANGFGLMSSSTFSNLSSNTFNIQNQNKNSQNEQNIMMSGLMSSNHGQDLSAASTMTIDHHASRNATDPSLLMMMQPNNTTNQAGKSNAVNEAEGSLTRDFLGVGGNDNRPFFSQNDLAKLGLFNGNH